MWPGIGSTAKAMWRNPLVRAGTIGAGIGGAYGMFARDTSMIGGALMGAGMGVAGSRYGGSGVRGYLHARRGGWNLGSARAGSWTPRDPLNRVRALGAGLQRAGRRVALDSNRGYNYFTAL